MTKRMTTEQLEAIRNRAEAASEGPWRYNVHGDVINNYGSSVLAEQPNGRCRSYVQDAEFIAHSREDIPALLAEVERLREALEFYAPEHKYEDNISTTYGYTCEIAYDEGVTARKALGGDTE